MSAPAQLKPVRLEDDNDFFAKLKHSIPDSAVQIVRKYFNDYREKNTLIRFVENDPNHTGEEFDADDYRLGIAQAVSAINTEEPMDVILEPGAAIPLELFIGYATVAMLKMSLRRRLNNEIVFGQPGTNVDTQKFEKVKSLMESMQNSYVRECRAYKRGLGMIEAYGGLGTSYGWAYVVLR